MNNFGDFLYTLRKEKGLTQAALAESLGVTNKAVSKWETGEAMPETSLLLPIANIFGITVDELLRGSRFENGGNTEPEQPKADANEILNRHLFTRGKDEPETRFDKICGAVCATFILLGVAVYLFIGAFAGLWNPHWIIIPLCALGCGIIGIIFNLCDGIKRRKRLSEGKNPYTDAVCGIVMLGSIITYLCCGAFAHFWHPGWVIVIAGVAACGIIGTIGNAVISKNTRR